MTSKGMFITFEGIDGSGKSTQAKLLAKTLSTHGHDVLLTREPGGSDGAEQIRALVLEGNPDRWSAETEILLFTAARRDHMETLILPALAKGQIVICDRFSDSTRMYQGLTRGDLRSMVDTLTALMIQQEPDLTLLIDMDPDIGHTRAKARATKEERFEDFGVSLQAQMRAGFLKLAEEFSNRIHLIDGNKEINLVQAVVYDIVNGALK